MRTILLIVLLLIFTKPFSNAKDPIYQDYLVTKSNDTIYGKISWKNNIMVFVENENGKKKFRADKVKSFQRGAYRYLSIHTKFPEYLREVVNGELSYYVDSYLKFKYTIDYIPHGYLLHDEKLYSIALDAPKKESYRPYIPNDPNSNITIDAIDYQSNGFMSSFQEIIGEENVLYKLIKNKNFGIDDIEYLVKIYNQSKMDDSILNQMLNINLSKGFAKGYVILPNADTLHGSIKINERFILSEKIEFKNSKEEESKFEIKELSGYMINNRLYVNRIINKEKNKTALLKQISTGEISLYRDIKNSNYYLEKKKDEFILVDNTYAFIELFHDKIGAYERFKENDYKYFEIKSMVDLYNNAP